MKVTVYITPKKNVLDPQGAAVEQAMSHLGHKQASNVRVGKTIEFDVDSEESDSFHEALNRLCRDLFSNPVIEDYRYELQPSIEA